MKINIVVHEFLYKLFIIFVTLDSALSGIVFSDAAHDSVHTILLVGSLGCALADFLVKKYKRKNLILILMLFAFAVYTYINSAATAFIIAILSVVLAQDEEIDSVVKIMYYMRLTILLITVALAFLGVLPLGIITSVSAEKSVMLGYGHANIFAGNAGVVVFLGLALKRKHFKFRNYGLLIVAAIGIFYFSRSRTELIVMTIVAAVLPIILFSEKFSRRFISFSKYIILIIVSLNFTLIFMQMFNLASRFINAIGALFNGRIFLAMNYIQYYGISLLGKAIDQTRISSVLWYSALDNGYTYILLSFGIVGLAFFVAFEQMAMTNFVKKQDSVMCLIGIAFCIWSIYEGMMVSAQTNFTLLYAAGVTVAYRKQNNEIAYEYGRNT